MLNLSYLKLLAGVFFALFILSACGGGGGDAAAPAAAAAPTCEEQDLFDNGTECVAKLTVSECVVDGYNGVNSATNTCFTYTEPTCLADGKYWDSSSCVAKITSCETNQHVVNNVCTTYTAQTCVTDGKYWDGSSCEAKLTLADCTDNTHIVVAIRNTCEADAYTPKVLADFDDRDADNNGIIEGAELTAADNEYSRSGVLESVNAAQAYLNIEALIDGDNNTNTTIKQGGEGQIISIYSNINTEGTSDLRRYDDSYAGLADTANPVFVAGYNAKTPANTDIGVCPDDACKTAYIGFNHSLNGLAGRRDGSGIHGIAYAAKIKMVTLGNATQQTQTDNGFAQAGTNGTQTILAMVHDRKPSYTYDYVGTKFSILPILAAQPSAVAGLKGVVDAGTMIISHAGAQGANSLNGIMRYYAGDDIGAAFANQANDVGRQTETATAYYGSAAAADNARFRNTVTHADFTGSWIVAVGVDASGVIYETSNGCGSTKQYCLSVPEIDSAANDGTTMLAVNAAYTLAGAFAVMKGAYPNLASTQLISLALGTADYIDNSIGEVDSATDGKYNAVYGHGLLNLDAATSLSATDAGNANIISSSSSPIGAIWGDTKLTLSSHFGNGLDSVNLGVQDKYGRHFVLDAPQTSYAPIAISLDDYMANMLGDDSQSQTLGTQAKLNYSNSGETWMNLEYISGKATTKIAFQDSYKINPLSDTGTTTILRANNIRPASNNIGMMDVDYQLGNALSLSSYLARGEYDTGYKFDELATDFDVNYKDSHLNIAIGNIREHGQFLGTNTSGAYALNAPSISRFTDVTYGHDVGNKFNVYANYINYETDVDMLYDQFASIDGLQADQYQIGFTGKDLISKDDSLNVALITKLGVTDGALNQNTVLGYTADGAFNNASQSYDLAVNQRHQQFEITYQGKLYQNADKISAIRDNRFFTSIRVDSNLNHVQGASQVEVVSGINIRY